MRRLVALTILCLFGCGPRTVEPLPPTDFRGLLVQGTVSQAKAAGYRSCESVNERRGYICTRDQGTSFFGVPTSKAAVTLFYPNIYANPEDQRASALRFWGVTLTFASVELRRNCEVTDPADPNICAKDKSAPLAELERRLAAEGWLASRRPAGWRSAQRSYFKAGEQIVIEVDGNAGSVVVQPVFAGDAEGSLAEIAREPPVNYSDPEAERAGFIAGMAK